VRVAKLAKFYLAAVPARRLSRTREVILLKFSRTGALFKIISRQISRKRRR